MVVIRGKIPKRSEEKESPLKEKSSGYKYTPLFPKEVYEEAPDIIKELSSFFEGMGRQKEIFRFL